MPHNFSRFLSFWKVLEGFYVQIPVQVV